MLLTCVTYGCIICAISICKRGKRLIYGTEPGRHLPGPEEIKIKVKMLKITDAIIRPKKNKLSITIIVFEQLL